MRILILGPTGGGSIPPYLDVLADALRNHGALVDRAGSPCIPYDQRSDAFWPAEAEHLDYYRRNPSQPYCAYVISPKVQKVRKKFARDSKSRSS